MKKEIFDSFFHPYSQTVDEAAKTSSFWKLSDALITEIIQREIAPFTSDESIVMDAGGGTGRWAVKLSEILRGRIIVFDRSPDMLAQAQKNIAASNASDRIDITEGDLIGMHHYNEASVDHVVSIYSPLSFIYEQEKAACELFRILKPGGRILIMSHGYYNAIASKINNYKAEKEELSSLAKTRMVKWAPHVPELVTHSKESMEQLFSQAGFHILKTYGVPVFIQPGSEDFDPQNKTQSEVSAYLDSPDIFKTIFDLEMQFNAEATIANRGMNMFMLAEKR